MPHTRSRKANRLILEQSPYLLQHAYNPVDWYPWGDEAFAEANNKDKPIFLSIGYSTCHWCHVMERESFEDNNVAAVLNRIFVCVKVDREERPDLDSIYMTACQAMTGSGGWPLTIIMTPDKRPFFTGTYLPQQTRFGQLGLLELAERVELLWLTARRDLEQTAAGVLAGLRAANSVNPGESLSEDVLHLAYEQLAARYDPQYGGFGGAPKFPTPHNLTFLLRYWQQSGKAEALTMVENTLQQMSRGGVYDQLGFGFHRYSTDREWMLPHFEKMLYDQALLAVACLETYQATGRSGFAETATEIFTYVLRDMTGPDGAFYSAEDADSEGEEGSFYLWSTDEIRDVLGEEDAALFSKAYHIRREGNFLDEATRQPTGKNILHLDTTLTSLAASLALDSGYLAETLRGMKKKLFLKRIERIHPYKDDKVLTDWNGLMIAALALGGRILADDSFTQAARRAAQFLLTRLKKDGRLLKRYRQGDAALPAHLDDYAFTVWGLLELYETTLEPAYLKEALALNQSQKQHFFDSASGCFFFTADDTEEVLVRQREFYDGAIPSGNSLAALNNLRLARLTGNISLEETALGIIRACAGELSRQPAAYTQMLSALSFVLGPSLEVVVAGEAAAADTQKMLKQLRSRFIPRMVVLLRPSGEPGNKLVELAPFSGPMTAIDGRATAYVCRNHTCLAPVTEPGRLAALLSFSGNFNSGTRGNKVE